MPLNLNLKRPCNNCPFRRDTLKGWLGRSRAQGLIDDMINDHRSFSCHKTTVPGEEDDPETAGTRVYGDKTEECAGGMILLHKTQQPNMAMRLGYVYKMFDGNELKDQHLVFDTPEEFVDHHDWETGWE